ncbi:MAG: S26 family signal peptidase, partial [Terriglobales bacterium]
MISKKKKLAAGVISALVPGAGQFLVRRTTAGIVWAAAFLVFLLVSSLARFWSNYYGLVVSAWGVMIFASVAAFNASFRPKGEVGPSRFWVILFIAVAFVPTQLMQVAWWLGGYRVFIVPSTSMQPTIWIGDRIIADSHYFRTRHIKQGEIIVFKKDDLSLVKRVEAVPG